MSTNPFRALIISTLFLYISNFSAFSQSTISPRKVTLLDKGWEFHKGEISYNPEKYRDLPQVSGTPILHSIKGNTTPDDWEKVTVPHDWAIYGPFDLNIDSQEVAITQNLETKASIKTGRTGALPYVGVGWYYRTFDVEITSGAKCFTLLFDGAMSEAKVFVNNKEVCFWPYGYNSFFCDITDYISDDGLDNSLAVRLENRPQSSRWYPGAGLYRNVYLIETAKTHIPVWGTYITTPCVSEESAQIKLLTEIEGASSGKISVKTEIKDGSGSMVAHSESFKRVEGEGFVAEQTFTVANPHLWSPETPNLYCAYTYIYDKDILVDIYTTSFGIRSIEVVPEKGFLLNGKIRKFKGVCLHHDLGPLGTAVNTSALRRQLTMLKDMGCDAIRTTHNMPAPEQIALCDQMGFMVIVENFDEWDVAKCKNGYHRFFDQWAEKDMVNMVRHYRNNPSVVMWSIGNEVPTQWKPEGYKVATFLRDICHREDPTRPVTCGMDQIDAILGNGFGAIMDVPGFNYRDHKYLEGYRTLPQKVLLGSETASTVSSRGVYHFPAEKRAGALHPDHQSSSYDLEYCYWSNLPDDDFALAEDYPWTMGQFVWTGFDYLGEPTPYDSDSSANHSSLFGIIDLASIPKDRYYLYRSIWNTDENTLHVLPHWTWPGREGEITPVFAYTNYPSAELFINGQSYGVRSKNDSTLQNRYRLMWYNAVYQPGELKVVAYDSNGAIAEEKTIKTAEKAHHIEIIADRNTISANEKELVYLRIRAVDKNGNLCPFEGRNVKFKVRGKGRFKAAANGDPTCLDIFHSPQMHLFSGELTAIVEASDHPGKIRFKASAKGLKKGIITITTK